VPTSTDRRAAVTVRAGRRRPPGLAILLVPLLVTMLPLAACGSSGGVLHASAPPLPDTTGPATATASPTVPPPSPSPSATPSPTATPTPTAGSEGGVERVPVDDTRGDATVAADLYPSSGAVTCPGMGSMGYGACPVTARLADRLNQHPVSGAEQLCRCTGTWQGVSITAPAVLPALDTYTVEVVLDLGSGNGKAHFDIVVLRTADGWFADDILCHGGGQSTSIYASSPPAC
jgi:hypothetical protein